MDIWNTVRWGKEARDLAPDPVSGAEITRLSGSALHTFNNYHFACCSPDGRRVLGVRLADMVLDQPCALVAHDVVSKHAALLDGHCATPEVIGAPFSGVFHYVDDRDDLCRVSLDTFRKETIMPMRGLPAVADVLRAVTADGRYLYYSTVMSIAEGLTTGIVRVDLVDGAWEIIYAASGFHGMVYLPGIDALIVGMRTLPDGSMPPLGIWMQQPGLSYASVLLKTDGTLIRTLGTPPGYNTYLPSTGQSVCNGVFDGVNFRHLPERPTGNMMVYASLDWENPRLIETPEHLCYHIARSRDDKYVTSEAYRVGQGIYGPLDILVANVQTGKTRVLVSDCGTKPSGSHWRQATPYFTSDNSHVIYNADPGDVTHVFSAKVPEGFYATLE